MKTNISIKTGLLLLIWGLVSLSVAAKKKDYVQGVVKDSLSGEAISFATIQLENTNVAILADIDGRFLLKDITSNRRIKVSSVGYKAKTVVLPDSTTIKHFVIRMESAAIGLNELVVKPKRYSRKENPAVALIRKTIEHKEQNRMKNGENKRYELYEKLTLYWDNFNHENKLLKKNFDFIENHLDSSVFTGKQVLPLSIREMLVDIHYDKPGSTPQREVIAKRAVGAEEPLNDGSLDAFLFEVFKEVDIYEDNIDILLNKFVSPTSSTLATSYYKYYIQDTLFLDGIRCVNVAFFPFNPESFSFNGNLYIALDDNYAVKRADLTMPRHLNINFLEDLRIVQHFNKYKNGVWVNDREDVYANFEVNDLLSRIYAHQVRSYRQSEEKNDTQFLEKNAVSKSKDEQFWQARRHLSLKKTEADLPDLIRKLRQVPIYKYLEKFIEISFSGYVKTANEPVAKSKLDIGSLHTLYGYNPIERHRLRLGLMTTAHFSPRFFFSGYLAYGQQDRRWKYATTAAYSLLKKKNYLNEFPRHDLAFSAEYDLYSLGVEMDNEEKDNLFVALGTAGIANRSYQNRYKWIYTHDWMTGFGISTWWQHINDVPAGTLRYRQRIAEGTDVDIAGFSLSKIGFEISYMPGMENFGAGRSGKNSKVNFVNDNIRLRLRHEYAYKGFSGGDYAYSQTQLGISDRFWLSSFGHIDLSLSAGKVWNQVPFPLLVAPKVNPSLFMRKNRFHLMRPFEFVADEYVALHINYFLKGWILNRLPFLKRLKLREVITFNGYYGNLTDKNNPDKTFGVFVLPQSAHPMFGDIYMEGSVGVENIFQLFRIDYFRRFTQLDIPGAKQSGIRIGVRFAF